MRSTTTLTAIAAIVTLGLLTTTAHAYNARNTHRWITRQAAKLLVEAFPGRYDELLAYVDNVAEGSEHEDDLYADGDTDPFTLRVMRHFFRPTDRHGLTIFGATYPSSYDWAIVGHDSNQWDWNDGLAAYAAGDRAEAYFILGHMVHLVQDLTVPAHTHLDQHGPPSGDDYESYCSDRSKTEFDVDLPLPPHGTLIPRLDTPLAVWLATARASYARNLYAGRLSGVEATGDIVKMFPNIELSTFGQVWTIDDPAVGELNTGFFEREPDQFYFKTTRQAAQFDVETFDASVPSGHLAANTTGKSMAALFARDLIPVAILHSAALMRLYLDAAFPLAMTDPPDDPGSISTGCDAAGSSRGCGLVALAFAITVVRRKRWSV